MAWGCGQDPSYGADYVEYQDYESVREDVLKV